VHVKYVESVGRECAVDGDDNILCTCTCSTMRPCPVHDQEWRGNSLILEGHREGHQEHTRG
jgi:hypothetical protein